MKPILSLQLILIILCIAFFFSCRAFQYGTDFPMTSKFIGIDSSENKLNIHQFIQKYGNPTAKTMDKENNILIENLFYTEKLQNMVLTTKFIFKNSTMSKMEIFNMEQNFQSYMDSIRWEISVH